QERVARQPEGGERVGEEAVGIAEERREQVLVGASVAAQVARGVGEGLSQEDGGLIVERVCGRGGRAGPPGGRGGEAAGARGGSPWTAGVGGGRGGGVGGEEGHGVAGGTVVGAEAGEGELARAGPAADLGVRLEYEDRYAGLREEDRGSQSVGTRPDDNCVGG